VAGRDVQAAQMCDWVWSERLPVDGGGEAMAALPSRLGFWLAEGECA
jgi:hypothetical protein